MTFGQNGCHFAEDIFKCIFMDESFCIWIKISLKFDATGPIDNKSALFQIMAWHWTGNKPLPEPVLAQSNDVALGVDELSVYNLRALSQYKDRLIYVWRFPC